MYPDRKALIVVVIFVFFQPVALFANGDKAMLLDLAGNWKFSIGDNKEWIKPDFNDSSWESIKVPSAWEDQGFYGYDGFGWYRTSFTVTREMKNRELYLTFGYIGDVDQVFLNGKLIGFSGSFPPQYSSAPIARRQYPIPESYLNLHAKNVISVRVYNQQMEGGIVSGEVGIISYNDSPDVPLAGMWYFRTGDNRLWKDSGCPDKHWKKIVVPGNWENQGYKDFNGIAWYRKHFVFPKELGSSKMILVLGKIRDADEVYINGVWIGSNGEIQQPAVDNDSQNEEPSGAKHARLKYYVIPINILKVNKLNTIAIKVFNDKDKGGLLEGPVGLVKTVNFSKFQREFSNDIGDN